jgi:very-short-patch-repair endonuclease
MSQKLPYIPYDKRLVEKARKNRKNPTPAEKRMWFQVLRNKAFQNLKFTRQKPLDRFIVDFYCSRFLLVVEIDGDSHTGQEEYDRQRTERLGRYGITVVRYTNIEVMKNLEGVYEDLQEKVKMLKKDPLPRSKDRDEVPP